MLSVGILFSLLLGWFAGGVANWLADHLPHANARQALAAFRVSNLSHYWTLGWYFRRAACPHCGAPRPLRAPLLEVSMAATFAITFVLTGQELLRMCVLCFYALLLLTILVIDLEHRRVLNVMLGPAAVGILLLSLLPGMPGITNALLGGIAGFAFFFVLALLGRNKLGAGDVKLAGLLGLMTGYPAVWNALLLGIVLGGIGALLLLATKRVTRKSMIAYAPYLTVGTLVTLWYGFF